MNPLSTPRLKRVFREQLADSARRQLPRFTPRRIHGRVRMPGKATAVVGMRRVGKTTFLHQLRAERIAAGVPKERLPYVSFEDERLAGLDGARLHLLLDEYYRQFPVLDDGGDASCPGTRPVVTWHLDEIQVVPDWERFVRRLLDTGDAEVVVTGSSAAMLSKEIATALRGRAWQAPLHPFSFAESLEHQGRPAPDSADPLTGPERASLERAFLDWLGEGGFPEAQGLDRPTRHQLLRDYVDVAIYRDVLERHQVRNAPALRWLVRHLLGNAAGRFSIQKFYVALKSQGIAVAKDTLHELLAHLEDCFLVRAVQIESASVRQRMVNPRKAYPADTGLIPVFDRAHRANTGHALETAVLIELERRRCEVSYVRTPEGYEMDFLARSPDGREELIQVCADLSDSATASREFRALAAAGVQFPQARQRLLTLTRDGLPAEDGFAAGDGLPAEDGFAAEAVGEVDVRPAYEWMLERTEGRPDGSPGLGDS